MCSRDLKHFFHYKNLKDHVNEEQTRADTSVCPYVIDGWRFSEGKYSKGRVFSVPMPVFPSKKNKTSMPPAFTRAR